MRRKAGRAITASVAGLALVCGMAYAGLAWGDDASAQKVSAVGNPLETAAMQSANNDEGVGGWVDPGDDELSPKVTYMDDGTAIQRTPTEYLVPSANSTSPMYHPERNVPFNTYYLNADNKGCGACHDDLAQVVANMPYGHLTLASEANDIEVTVQMCLDCHDPDGNYSLEYSKSFGTTIHNVHAKNGITDCQSCHDMTEDGRGIQLWDVVKHERLHAITDIDAESMNGDFAWRQDETFPQSRTIDINWDQYGYDYTRGHHVANDDPLDQNLFDNWTITVTGLDGQMRTWLLPDLISEAEDAGAVVTEPIKLNCQDNVTGGPLINQVECTGVSLKWMAEQVGGLKGVNSVTVGDADAYTTEGIDMSHLEDDQSFLVYQMGGEPLSWSNGYPCMVASGGVAYYCDVKQACDIVLSADEPGEIAGWYEQDTWRYNKPNVGLFDVREGQIIKTGETFQFHGYADAYDTPVTAIEISMDRGKTWKRYDLDGANTTQWVTWTYDFTPQQDGAYTIYVRCEMEGGTYTEEPIEKMVVAKSEIPEASE